LHSDFYQEKTNKNLMMYAIVEIAGQQFKVEKDREIFVHRLEGEEGSSVEFENVMLVDNDGKISVGMPNVSGIKIKAKILEHMKADKVLVFHKKRRKGYQKQNGHRQYMSKILIEDILTGVKKAEKKAETKKEAPKKEVKPKAEVKAKAKPKAEKKEVKPKAEKKEDKPKAEATPKVKKETKPKTAPKAKKEAEDKKED
jgi:large subunit ribosomal protein L21